MHVAIATCCLFGMDRPGQISSSQWISTDQRQTWSWKIDFGKVHPCRCSKIQEKNEVIISFFFNARGDELEKSTAGMYRALLVQLLSEAVDLQEILDGHKHAFQQRSKTPMWTTEMLSELFSLAVIKLERRQLKVFIDALDECDEDQIRQMIDLFEDLGQKAFEAGIKIYICFASRHYPTIEIQNGRQLTLEKEDSHGEDLGKYIHKHLKVGARKDEDVEKIRVQILEKAKGVFMWAVLVIPLLNKEFQAGRQFAVKKRLEEVLLELSSLFKHILNRDRANLDDFLLCLQWILYAKRPLKREEFYFAMLAGLDPDSDSMTAWHPEHITDDDMNRFVLSSSKGLAELTRSKTPTVQFIHESVRDFLVKDNGLCELWPELKIDLYSLSHDQLKRCCLEYLAIDLFDSMSLDEPLPKAKSDAAKRLRGVLTDKFPLVEYASRYVLQHADEAAMGVPQDKFLAQFPLQKWIEIRNYLERHGTCRHTPDASIIYILAELNLARLIKTAHRSGSDPHSLQEKGERYRYPILAALANIHREAAQTLLSLDGPQVSEDVFANSNNYRHAFSPEQDETVLMWALTNSHKSLAKALLISTLEPIDLSKAPLRSHPSAGAFDLACGRGYTDIVLQMLDKVRQDLKSKDLMYRGLTSAAESGHEDIVALLLKWAPIVNYRFEGHGYGPLFFALQNGHEQILKLLLDAGIDAVPEAEAERSLEIASRFGFERMVKRILGSGAQIPPHGYHKALYSASYSGYDKVVRILLDAGVDIITQQGYDDALEVALRNDYDPTVKILIDAGAHVNTRNSNGESALQAASCSDYELMVQMRDQLRRTVRVETNVHKDDSLPTPPEGRRQSLQAISSNTATSQIQRWMPTIANLLN